MLVGSEMQDLVLLLWACFCVALVLSVTQKDHKSQFNTVVQCSRTCLSVRRNCFLEPEIIRLSPFIQHNCRDYFPFLHIFQNMDSRHIAKNNLKYSALSCVSWCSVLTAGSQMLVRGLFRINTVHLSEIPPGGQEAGVGWKGWFCFPLGQSEVRTHIQVGFFFFSFMFFYFATRCSGIQRPHPSLSSCLIWTKLSYPSHPKHRTCYINH